MTRLPRDRRYMTFAQRLSVDVIRSLPDQTMLGVHFTKKTAALCANLTVPKIGGRSRRYLTDRLPTEEARDLRASLSKRLAGEHSDSHASGANSTSVETYAEDTPLTWIFGDYPEARIVATFLSEPETALTLKEIKRLSGVDDNDLVVEQLEHLEKYGMIRCDWEQDHKISCVVDDTSDTVDHLRKSEQSLLCYWYSKQEGLSTQDPDGPSF